jgi:hypothetical protein
MILQHFSDKIVPLEQLYNVSADFQNIGFSTCKPTGLWVSVKGKDDWPHFCRSAFGTAKLAYCHRVEIDASNVLIIDTEDKLKDFHLEYQVWSNMWGTRIHWPRIAKDYAGIIIAPYFWDSVHLFEGAWGWDCASGCIWFAKDVVKSIRVEVRHKRLLEKAEALIAAKTGRLQRLEGKEQ